MDKKDRRLPKQLGDFGESLAMFLIGQLFEHKVALIDHAGADILATNDEDGDAKKLYAISVKTRCFTTDGPQFAFNADQQEKLTEFAESFGAIPTIAFVSMDDISVNKDTDIDVYIIELQDFRKLAELDSAKGITVTGAHKNILHFSNAPANQEYLQNHPLINHVRLTLRGHQ